MHILNLGGSMLVAALRQLGHTVLTVSHESAADIMLRQPCVYARLQQRLDSAGFRPDAVLYCDNGNLPLLLDPENIPLPAVWYSIDTYCNPWHIPYGYGFDLVFVAQKDFVPLFAQEAITARWLPLFCSDSLISCPESCPRDIPVAFVGTVGHSNNPDRKPFLEAFRRRHPLVCRSGNFVPIFRRANIVLNQTAFSEVNFRCFEAMACGAALLMEDCGNGLTELFTPGQEMLPLYRRNDAAAAAVIAAQALAAPRLLKDIASAGQQAVMARHTATARAAALVESLAGLANTQAHISRRTHQKERRTQLVRAAFGVLASDFSGPEWNAYRVFYANAALGRMPE